MGVPHFPPPPRPHRGVAVRGRPVLLRSLRSSASVLLCHKASEVLSWAYFTLTERSGLSNQFLSFLP